MKSAMKLESNARMYLYLSQVMFDLAWTTAGEKKERKNINGNHRKWFDSMKSPTKAVNIIASQAKDDHVY